MIFWLGLPHNPLYEPPREWYVLQICKLYGCTASEALDQPWDMALTHLELHNAYEEWERKKKKGK